MIGDGKRLVEQPKALDYMAQVRTWPVVAQADFARLVEEKLVLQADLFRSRRQAEFFSFREVRDVLLRDGQILLEQVPEWGLQGRAPDQAHFDKLESDSNYTRMKDHNMGHRCYHCHQAMSDCRCQKVASLSPAKPGKLNVVRDSKVSAPKYPDDPSEEEAQAAIALANSSTTAPTATSPMPHTDASALGPEEP